MSTSLALVFTLLIAGCAADDSGDSGVASENPLRGDADAIATGALLYDEQCSVCHDTVIAPPLAPIVPSRTDEQLYTEIAKGNDAMPAYEDELSETQIWQIISFLQSQAEE